MGVFDKAKDVASDHPDQVEQGIEKGGDAADERTGGKHEEHVDKVQETASEHTSSGSGTEEPPPSS